MPEIFQNFLAKGVPHERANRLRVLPRAIGGMRNGLKDDLLMLSMIGRVETTTKGGVLRWGCGGKI